MMVTCRPAVNWQQTAQPVISPFPQKLAIPLRWELLGGDADWNYTTTPQRFTQNRSHTIHGGKVYVEMCWRISHSSDIHVDRQDRWK